MSSREHKWLLATAASLPSITIAIFLYAIVDGLLSPPNPTDLHEYGTDPVIAVFRLSAFVSSILVALLIRSRRHMFSSVVCIIPLAFFANSVWTFFERYERAVRLLLEDGQNYEFVNMGFTQMFISRYVSWWDAYALIVFSGLVLWQAVIIIRGQYQARTKLP